MKDKVQKIREGIEKLKSQLLRGACASQIAMETRCKEEAYNEVLSILDSLQEEPVSIWHDASEKPNYEKNAIIVITSYKGEYIGSRFYNPSDISCNIGVYDKWAYLNDLLNLSNVQRTTKNWKEPVSEELEEAIDTYLKSYWGGEKEKQEWPFLKKIAIYFAKWQKEQMMAKATDVEVKVDAGGYPYIPQMELYDYDKDVPLAKAGDRYKVILIKEG